VSFSIVAPNGTQVVTLTANQKIAVQTRGEASIFELVGFPNYPAQQRAVGRVVNGTFVSSAFTSGATLIVNGGPSGAFFNVGTDPIVGNNGNWQRQGAPVNVTDGGSMIMTPAGLLSGIVTATPTQARNVQLPSVADLVAASNMALDDSFDWSLITLAAFALTVTANGSSTIVGSAATGNTAGAVARFRTRRSASDAFVTYRIG
jgi:hypothetical protein